MKGGKFVVTFKSVAAFLGRSDLEPPAFTRRVYVVDLDSVLKATV